MSSPSTLLRRAALVTSVAGLAACGSSGSSGTGAPPQPSSFVLGSVVIDADGGRTTYVQTIPSLDAGPFTNDTAIEAPGNGVVLAGTNAFYVGLAESPTWVRYSVASDGSIAESGRLSLLGVGATAIDYGNAIVDEDTAVSVLSSQAIAVVWDPSSMTIRGEIDLGHLVRDGFGLEVWTTVAHEGRVYVPARYSDWTGGRIGNGVSVTIIDPDAMTVVATATDDRCASGGRIVFDEAGYGYVMGDGRTYSVHMFANAAGETAPPNCLLRIPPGGTDFEDDYYYPIPSLTGGLESIGELETAWQGSGVGFTKVFYPDRLPADVEPIDFTFWGYPAHKTWGLELADPPIAREVSGLPFSTIGFTGSPFDGFLYSGESPDGNTSEVYELDPVTNAARPRFSMDGYFYGLFELAS